MVPKLVAIPSAFIALACARAIAGYPWRPHPKHLAFSKPSDRPPFWGDLCATRGSERRTRRRAGDPPATSSPGHTITWSRNAGRGRESIFQGNRSFPPHGQIYGFPSESVETVTPFISGSRLQRDRQQSPRRTARPPPNPPAAFRGGLRALQSLAHASDTDRNGPPASAPALRPEETRARENNDARCARRFRRRGRTEPLDPEEEPPVPHLRDPLPSAGTPAPAEPGGGGPADMHWRCHETPPCSSCDSSPHSHRRGRAGRCRIRRRIRR